MNKIDTVIGLCLISMSMQAQAIKWFNPQQSEIPCIQQRGWADEMKNSYARLPDRARAEVREPVWKLSRNAAGLAIYFYTNAPEIRVRYTVSGGLNMPHMPSTGVSGVDLYSVDKQGHWMDNGVKYLFGDTIVYTYTDLSSKMEREYRLYLPLYNSVTWMEIGVPEGSIFKVEPVRREKPIVVYGTSIAQGACASRPGNAWTNILARKLDWPVVNFGFSGNGQLEPEVLKYINEVDGAAYLLDCYPNLGKFTVEEKTRRTIEAVRTIRAKHAALIVIVQHTGFNQDEVQALTRTQVAEANEAAQKAYDQLKNEVKDLHLMTFDESVRTTETTAEGIHPNDYGMVVLAGHHETFLRQLLRMPKGTKSTMIPVTQRREPGTYDWQARHQDILRQNAEQAPRRVIMGNSITHYWGGAHRIQDGKESWNRVFVPAGYRNMGYGWDYVQNVLWRVYHGELDGFEAEKVVLNIGTNNLTFDSDEDIVEGLLFLLAAIHERQPKAAIKVVALYPRRAMEERVAGLNRKIEQAVLPLGYEYCDVGSYFLKPDGKIDETLFRDGLHPNAKGYERIAAKVAE